MINILYATITGADDETSIMDMFDLSARYPFVEWGILFSQSKAGVPRYPSFDWVEELCELHQSLSNNSKPHFSAHLCGKWVSDVLESGHISFFDDKNLFKTFGRTQLNCGQDRLKEAIDSKQFWKAALRLKKPVILGGNYSGIKFDVRKGSQHGVYPLFDASGGRGRITKDWLPPFTHEIMKPEQRLHLCNTHCCGYAGGLGPDNISEELDRIAEVVGVNQCWIDMESNVRTKTKTKDYLDLDKVEKVLEIVQGKMI
jgi:hypothetical protein